MVGAHGKISGFQSAHAHWVPTVSTPRSPLILIGILCLISHSLSQALASIENFALALLFFFFLDFRWRLVYRTNYKIRYPTKVSLRNINSGGLFWTSNLGINATLQEKRKTFLGQRNRVNEFFY